MVRIIICIILFGCCIIYLVGTGLYIVIKFAVTGKMFLRWRQYITEMRYRIEWLDAEWIDLEKETEEESK